MINRIAQQTTAFALAAVFTCGILASINLLAIQPGEHNVMAAEKAASQVATSVQGGAGKRTGG